MFLLMYTSSHTIFIKIISFLFPCFFFLMLIVRHCFFPVEYSFSQKKVNPLTNLMDPSRTRWTTFCHRLEIKLNAFNVFFRQKVRVVLEWMHCNYYQRKHMWLFLFVCVLQTRYLIKGGRLRKEGNE